MNDETQPLPVTPAGTTSPSNATSAASSDAPATGTAGAAGTPRAAGAPGAAWAASPYLPEPRPVSTAVRTSTIVWGAILVVAAVVVLATAAGMTLDLELVGIFALGGAGVALLVGTIATQARRRR